MWTVPFPTTSSLTPSFGMTGTGRSDSLLAPSSASTSSTLQTSGIFGRIPASTLESSQPRGTIPRRYGPSDLRQGIPTRLDSSYPTLDSLHDAIFRTGKVSNLSRASGFILRIGARYVSRDYETDLYWSIYHLLAPTHVSIGKERPQGKEDCRHWNRSDGSTTRSRISARGF